MDILGYTHYWYRKKAIPSAKYKNITDDFKKLLPKFEKFDIPLADGHGKNKPIIDEEMVWFNGSENCGHTPDKSVVIPWPTDDAGGVATSANAKKGSWFAGSLLQSRCCNGDCSYETFYFPKTYEPKSWEGADKSGKIFFFCKTAFRPYDVAVTAFLVIAKHYLGADIVVKSDGSEHHWFDGKFLCQQELGYGMEFKLDN